MFFEARRRLTLIYVGLFGAVLVAFSAAVYGTLATVLSPNFDIGPEVSSEQAAEIAYRATLDQVAVVLVGADVLVLAVVGGMAWLLAARTLAPIRAAHERQRRFVADASHEMRSPIAAIRTATESALARPAEQTDAADMRAALETVLAASERLTRLTTDLLALARADESPPRNTAPVDLSVLVVEAVEAERAARGPGAPMPDLRLTPDVVVRAEREPLGRAVGNLVDNAFRHGGPNVHVRVSTFQSGDDAVVEVSDDGPGIAALDTKHIFEPFYRARSDADAPSGSGLGLAIAATVARQSHGRLVVQSEPGAGATFRVLLPRFS